jgi:hypothetical protein
MEIKKEYRKDEEDRLISEFMAINDFYQKYNREPSIDSGNVSEFQLAARLKSLRKNALKMDLLQSYDIYSLFESQYKLPINQKFNRGTEYFADLKDKSIAFVLDREARDFSQTHTLINIRENLKIVGIKVIPKANDKAYFEISMDEFDFYKKRWNYWWKDANVGDVRLDIEGTPFVRFERKYVKDTLRGFEHLFGFTRQQLSDLLDKKAITAAEWEALYCPPMKIEGIYFKKKLLDKVYQALGHSYSEILQYHSRISQFNRLHRKFYFTLIEILQ